MKGGLLGALIGAGTGLIGTGINAIMGARKARAEQRALAQAERDNQLWRDRRYNEVGRELDGVRGLITQMREAQKARMDRASGANTVVGGSSARVAEEAAAANKELGNAIGRADDMQRREARAIESQYLARKDGLRGARMRSLAADKANLANAATQAGVIGANIAASAIGGDGVSGAASAKADEAAASGAGASETAGTNGATGNANTVLSYSNNPYYGKTTEDNLNEYWRKQLGNIYGTVWNQ